MGIERGGTRGRIIIKRGICHFQLTLNMDCMTTPSIIMYGGHRITFMAFCMRGCGHTMESVFNVN